MKKRISLLLDLTDSDFETILTEFDYIFNKKFRCHYVIDMYEINGFCYPLGTRSTDKASQSKTIAYIADEQYTFNRLFESETEKIILLDEYIPELLSLKKIIANSNFEALNAAFQLDNYYKSLQNEIPPLKDADVKEINEIVRSKLTQALAIILDKENMGFSKIVNLIKRGRLLYSKSSSIEGESSDILKTAFDIHKGSQLTEEIFDKLLYLEATRSKTRDNINLNTVAHYRDARVIDRLSTINNHLQSSFDQGKTKMMHLIYYLSSSSKSERLFTETDILKNLPRIGGKPFNPLRNKRQLFLKYLCLSNDYNESVQNINSLRMKLTEIKELYFHADKNNQQLGEEMVNNLKREFNHYREYFENNAILNKYAAIKTRLRSALILLRSKGNSDKFLLKIGEYIEEIGEKTVETTIARISSLEDWAIQIRYSVFVNSFLSQENEAAKLYIKTGKDIIRGTIHHLPLLMEFSDEVFQQEYTMLAQELLLPHSEIALNSLKSITLISSYENKNNNIAFYEEKLFKAFMLLLMPDDVIPNENLNEITYEWINNTLYQRIYRKERAKDFDLIIANYYYFIGWTLRRCNRIPESIKLFKEAISKFPKDGRFFHGLSLSQYCLFMRQKDANDLDLELLRAAIANAEFAIKYYTSSDIITRKSVSGLQNTISYFYALLYKDSINKVLPESLFNLKQAGVYLDELKKSEIHTFRRYPDFLHTEAIVRFCEYEDYVIKYEETGDFEFLELALDKITIAADSILDSIDIEDTPSITVDRKKYHRDQNDIIKEKQRFIKKYFRGK